MGKLRVGFAICSSFCSLTEVIKELKKIKELGHEIVIIPSRAILENDTRFNDAWFIKEELKKISSDLVTSIIEAEEFGPIKPIDILVIAPTTGTTLARLANGISDTNILMTAKTTLRNSKPIVIALATNDALGLNGVNLIRLINTKNIYFVPFGQDDYIKKPRSLVADFSKIIPTMDEALLGRQIEPILLRGDDL